MDPLKNWKTSIMGALAGLPYIFDGVIKQDATIITQGIGLLLLGIFAKDGNVTGGIIDQTKNKNV